MFTCITITLVFGIVLYLSWYFNTIYDIIEYEKSVYTECGRPTPHGYGSSQCVIELQNRINILEERLKEIEK